MRQQRLQHATHGTPGAQQQDAAAAQGHAGIEQVGDQPGAIGVVAQQATILQLLQGIHRTGAARTLGQLVGHAIGLLLERHGHVGTQAFAKEVTRERGEVIQRRQQRLIAQRLAGLCGEQRMNLR